MTEVIITRLADVGAYERYAVCIGKDQGIAVARIENIENAVLETIYEMGRASTRTKAAH